MAGERIKEAVRSAASRRRGKKLIKVEPKPTTFKSLVRDALWVHGHFSAPRAMLYVVFVLIIGLGTFLIWKDPVQGARIVLPYLVRAFETLMFYASIWSEPPTVNCSVEPLASSVFSRLTA